MYNHEKIQILYLKTGDLIKEIEFGRIAYVRLFSNSHLLVVVSKDGLGFSFSLMTKERMSFDLKMDFLDAQSVSFDEKTKTVAYISREKEAVFLKWFRLTNVEDIHSYQLDSGAISIKFIESRRISILLGGKQSGSILQFFDLNATKIEKTYNFQKRWYLSQHIDQYDGNILLSELPEVGNFFVTLFSEIRMDVLGEKEIDFYDFSILDISRDKENILLGGGECSVSIFTLPDFQLFKHVLIE